jgi:transcriptional regulator with XRE-family HTH domain
LLTFLDIEYFSCHKLGMYAHIDLLKAARVALGLSQKQLAGLSGVSLRTVFRVENGEGPVGAIHKVQTALEEVGVKFLPERQERGPGMILPHEWRKRTVEKLQAVKDADPI